MIEVQEVLFSLWWIIIPWGQVLDKCQVREVQAPTPPLTNPPKGPPEVNRQPLESSTSEWVCAIDNRINANVNQVVVEHLKEELSHLSKESGMTRTTFPEKSTSLAGCSLRFNPQMPVCRRQTHLWSVRPWATLHMLWQGRGGPLTQAACAAQMAQWLGGKVISATSTTAMSRSDTPAYWLVFLKGDVSWSLLSPNRTKSWLWTLSTSSTQRRQVNATVKVRCSSHWTCPPPTECRPSPLSLVHSPSSPSYHFSGWSHTAIVMNDLLLLVVRPGITRRVLKMTDHNEEDKDTKGQHSDQDLKQYK